MKPLARLYITRQKVYEKECEVNESETKNEDDNESRTEPSTMDRRTSPGRCETTEYFEVVGCSVTCGTGFKILKR